jgi:hypothetical protein
MDNTLDEALVKFSEDTDVILPPAHKSAAFTFTILATLELELPTELGFDTIVKDAPS